MPPATVLLSNPPTSAGSELHRYITAAGFVVADHRLGSPPAVDFGPIAVAVIDAREAQPAQPGERSSSPRPAEIATASEVRGAGTTGAASAWTEVATAQTKRWRAELGDHFLPILWLAPADQVAAGLDAGADVVLAHPIEPEVFVAQLRALVRAQSIAGRVAVRAGEARLLGDQLRKALAQLEREQEMARRAHATFLPRTFPMVGGARFNVCYRPRSRSGCDFHDVRRLDEQHIGFFVGDVLGTSPATGNLLGMIVQQSVAMKEIGELSYRIVPPDEVLSALNRALLALGADELPLVAMLVGVVNARTGALTLARAGLPAAVYVPATGAPVVWTVPGAFLGAAETEYRPFSGTLHPGDRLLIGTDGTRPDGAPGPAGTDRLLEAASKHGTVHGAEFVDAVAGELLQHVRHADDFTLLCVEMAAPT